MTEPESSGPIGEYVHLRVERRGIAAYVTLSRPEVHNAFNARLIRELQDAFETLGNDDDVRAVVLAGDGPSFCAGADLNWMRSSLGFDHEENVADALGMFDMFRAIDSCRHPVIGRLHGAALGEGRVLPRSATLLSPRQIPGLALPRHGWGFRPQSSRRLYCARLDRATPAHFS